MEKEQKERKSVNFDKNAELNVYRESWDDEFDDDSDDDLPPPPINETKPVEKIELKEMDPVQYRNEEKQKFQVSINDCPKANARGSMRRGSMMRRRNTIYEPKPDNFSWDPTLSSPIEARVITDICCFMLFFVFLAIWAFSTFLVFNMGNLERFAVPKHNIEANLVNADDLVCGAGDSNHVSNPYELNFNVFQCLDPLVAFRTCQTQTVCVKACPTQSFSFEHEKRMKSYSENKTLTTVLRKKLSCLVNSRELQTMKDLEMAIENHKCAKITTKSFILSDSDYKSLQYKCIPDIFETEIDFVVDLLDNIVPQTNILWRITHEFTKRIGTHETDNSTDIESNKTMYTFSDMLKGWPVLIGFVIASIILTLILVYSLKYMAKFIFIIANVLNVLIMAFAMYTCYSRGKVFDEFSPNIFKNDTWGLMLVFTSTVAIIVLVQYVIEKRGTQIILELIKETTNAIQYIKTLLVFPLIFYCIRAAAILLSMYIGFTIKSTSETDFKLTNTNNCECNNYVHGGFCNPTIVHNCMSNCTLDCKAVPDDQKLHANLVDFSHLTNLIGYFWTSEYLYLLEHAILASIFATYYWTFHKRDLPTFTLFNGFYTSIRYHLGTVFFAWLFLCVYSYIRFEFQLIDGLLGLLPFSIVHFFFKYIVIVMALCGDDFYESAKEVIAIVKKNARLIFISKCMSEILFFYLKLLITGVMGILTYIVVICFGFINPGYFKNDLFPVYIVCMGTYLIATEIFNIYSLGVDTFTFCYIEDVSLNNGDMEKPYFMPRPLMRICNLKNKLDKTSYDNHLNLNTKV